MVELVDWDDLEAQNRGTPGWHVLAQSVVGQTRRPAERVFAAVEIDPKDGRCHVLVAADMPEFGPDVMTPYTLDIRIAVDGVDTFVLVGASQSREVRAATP